MFTEMPSFIFGGNTGDTPATLSRRRAIAEALASGASGRAPKDVGEGLTAIGQALAFRAMDKRNTASEAAGQASGTAAIAKLLSGGGVADSGADYTAPPDPAAPVDPAPAGQTPEEAYGVAPSADPGLGDPAAVDPTAVDPTSVDPAAVPPVQDAAAAPAQQTADAGPSLEQIIEASNNPWLSDTQKAVVGELLKQKLKQPDPNETLQTEKLRLEIEKMKNPDAGGAEYLARQKQAERLGMTPDDPRYQPYILTGNIPANAGAEDKYGERQTAAEQLGLKPDDPAYRSFILTGKMPKEDQQPLTTTDKKAILEADDMVAANHNAIDALTQAEQISGEANSGWLAGTRASVGNNLPDMLVPDAISSPDSSQATANLDNAVVGQALTSLRTIFGGNPTEGERKILLELQGSSSMTKPVRKEVFARAKALAQRRLEFNQQRANELRGETYYKPGGGASGQNGVEPPPAVAPIGAAPDAGAAPAQPQSDADFQALPSGALYVDPDDGQTYRKP